MYKKGLIFTQFDMVVC